MSAGPLPLARRTTLTLGVAGIAGIAVLSSCGEHIAGPAPLAAASSDPDTALVDSMLVALADAEQLAFAGGFTDLVLLHQAHIEALEGSPTAPEPRPRVGRRRTTRPAGAARPAGRGIDGCRERRPGTAVRLHVGGAQPAAGGRCAMTTLDALQTTLAAEHAAVYVYGVLGGRTSVVEMPVVAQAVSAAYAAHRARRDHLTGEIFDLGAEPVAAEAAYDDAARPDAQRRRSTRPRCELEQACATTYAWLVANTTETMRRWAITALNETAVREIVFEGEPEMFPGADPS